MSTNWLAMAFSIVLPALPLASSVFLLRRAVPASPHWFALAASGMVFAMSVLWLSKAADKLVAIFQGGSGPAIDEWLATTLRGGPGLSFGLLALSGGFWVYLARKQRTRAK